MQPPAAGESIAMTAPVVQTGANGTWTVRFLMPRGYTLNTLPTPKDKDHRVHLIPLPTSRRCRYRKHRRIENIANWTGNWSSAIASPRLRNV